MRGLTVLAQIMQQSELRSVQSFVGLESAVVDRSGTAAAGAPAAGPEDILYFGAAVAGLGSLVAGFDLDTL